MAGLDARPRICRSPDLVDMHFVASCPLRRLCLPHIRFLSIRPQLRYGFLQTTPRGGAPCQSFALHLHQVDQSTPTSKRPNVLGAQKEPLGPEHPGLRAPVFCFGRGRTGQPTLSVSAQPSAGRVTRQPAVTQADPEGRAAHPDEALRPYEAPPVPWRVAAGPSLAPRGTASTPA